VKIIIIEGIATSGKSTIIELLRKKLSNEQIKVYGEPDTHIPIMEQPDELHLDFFKSLIDEALSSQADYIIFDRLYLTQAFRAKTDISKYENIEDTLLQHQTLTAFLKVDDKSIAKRVQSAAGHREKQWGEYIKTKGKTIEEIAQYYIDQQSSQTALLAKSKIKSKVFDTTEHEYDKVSNEILSTLNS
jgi:thymidylate kinase